MSNVSSKIAQNHECIKNVNTNTDTRIPPLHHPSKHPSDVVPYRQLYCNHLMVIYALKMFFLVITIVA